MAAVRRTGEHVELRLDAEERAVLLDMVDALVPRLATEPRARQRAYDDARLEKEFARFARPDVEAARDADVEIVRDSLRTGSNRTRLAEPEALAWVRALNHLRLCAGGLLDIEDDGWDLRIEADTRGRPEYAMLMTLGWLQEGIVSALDGEP